jgi:hypothetical protein
MGFLACTTAGVRGVADRHTGIASGILNTSQQIGGALGLAVLAGLAASVTTGHSAGVATSEALTAGFSSGLRVGVTGYVAAALVAAIAFAPSARSRDQQLRPKSLVA